MKKLIAILIMIVFISSQSFAENSEMSFSFRNSISWGMTSEEVKRNEGLDDECSLQPYSTAGFAKYLYIEDVSVSKYSADLVYVFMDDQLNFAGYEFNIFETENAYEYLLNSLSSKYGEFRECEANCILPIVASFEYGDPTQINNYTNLEYEKCHYTVLDNGTYIYMCYENETRFSIYYVNKDSIFEAVGAYNTDGL